LSQVINSDFDWLSSGEFNDDFKVKFINRYKMEIPEEQAAPADVNQEEPSLMSVVHAN
jgi:hypothetical protein